MTLVRKFTQAAVIADPTLGERQIRVVASDPTVDRVKDIMEPQGCVLDNYKLNPIVLANHDPAFPIGNATPAIVNGRVEALIDFAPAGISAKADEFCALYKSGVLRAVSIGFKPIEATPIKGGGTRYSKWELMEISGVSVPANPNAVTLARDLAQAGNLYNTETGDIPAEWKVGDIPAEWKVGASRNLPISDDRQWDAEAAAKSIFAQAGFDGGAPDVAYARKGFLIYDASAPTKKESYKHPFAKVVAGRLMACPAGVSAATGVRLSKIIAEDVKQKAIAVLNHYRGKSGAATRPKIKSLYDCAELAAVLSHLGWIHSSAVWEEEVEQDASKLPAMLAALMTDCAAALNAMTAEETAELLAGHGIEVLPADEDYVEAGATPQIKALRAAFRKAGRAISAENAEHLTAIGKCLKDLQDGHAKTARLHDDLHDTLVEQMDHGTSLGDHLKALLKAAKPQSADDEDGTGSGNGDDVTDPEDADQELSATVAAQKRAREIQLLELTTAL